MDQYAKNEKIMNALIELAAEYGGADPRDAYLLLPEEREELERKMEKESAELD